MRHYIFRGKNNRVKTSEVDECFTYELVCVGRTRHEFIVTKFKLKRKFLLQKEIKKTQPIHCTSSWLFSFPFFPLEHLLLLLKRYREMKTLTHPPTMPAYYASQPKPKKRVKRIK